MISIPVSNGELLDKISILSIKLEKINDEAKRANVETEYRMLIDLVPEGLNAPRINDLFEELAQVNRKLWIIEDSIRACEREARYDQEFIDLARSVYINNDRRSEIKREINKLTLSTIIEEKSYTAY
jgi:hypothetical protein